MVHSATFQANESLKIQSYLFQRLFSKHEINNDANSMNVQIAKLDKPLLFRTLVISRTDEQFKHLNNTAVT
jgi:hypothetical protein